MNLVDHTAAADAYRLYSRDALWALFDGNRERLNIAHECLDRHVDAGDALTIVRPDAPWQTLSFAELSQWSGRVASWLVGRDMAKGHRVAVMLEPSLAYYAAVFGAMKAGAVAVPLFTLFGPDGLRARVEDCSPSLLIAGDETLSVARRVMESGKVLAGDDLLTAVAGCDADFVPATRASDMALFQYTSGTTRERPEAVPHTHRAVVSVAPAALYGLGIRPGDWYFCPSSPAWGHGMWHGTISPLALGVSTGSYAGRFDAAVLLRALADLRISNLAAASTHYRMMRGVAEASEHTYAIEKLSFTGEPMDSATAEFVETLFGTPACSMYGTTETGVTIVNFPGAKDFRVKRGALGKPIPGVELAVHDEHGRACAPGVTGQIVLRRRDGWFPTKDLGTVDEEGYYHHRGRADDVIISAGWTMSAAEIEDVLMQHPRVQECAVIGVPDETRGQVVKAFVVIDGMADDALADELKTFTRERLSQHEFPRLVAFVDELPKTPAGKINRRALRERERAANP